MKRTRCGRGELARAPRVASALVAVLTLTSVVACGAEGTGAPVTTAPLTVAATESPVSTVLAHIYAGALRRGGAEAAVVPVDGLARALTGLDDGSVSVLADFSGSLLSALDPESTAVEPDAVFDALARSLPEWLSVSDFAAAENRETVVVSASLAAELSEATLAGLAPRCADLTAEVGSGLEVTEAVGPLGDVYGCRFASAAQVAQSTPAPNSVSILRATDLGAADTATSLVTLADSEQAYVAQNVVPVVRKGLLTERTSTALGVVAGELTTAGLADMVERVRSGEDSGVVADSWLSELPFR